MGGKAWGWLVAGFKSSALGFAVLGAVAVFAQMVALCYEAIARYVFNKPTIWSVDVSGMLTVLIVFTGAAYVHQKDGHVKLTILSERVGEKAQTVLLIIASFFSMICTAVFTYLSWQLMARSFLTGRLMAGALQTPEWIPQAALPIGFFLFTLAILIKLVAYIRRLTEISRNGLKGEGANGSR